MAFAFIRWLHGQGKWRAWFPRQRHRGQLSQDKNDVTQWLVCEMPTDDLNKVFASMIKNIENSIQMMRLKKAYIQFWHVHIQTIFFFFQYQSETEFFSKVMATGKRFSILRPDCKVYQNINLHLQYKHFHKYSKFRIYYLFSSYD